MTTSSIELKTIIGDLSRNGYISEAQKNELLLIIQDSSGYITKNGPRTIFEIQEIIKNGPLDEKILEEVDAAGKSIRNDIQRQEHADTYKNLGRLKITILQYLEQILSMTNQ